MSALIHACVSVIRKQGQKEWCGEADPVDLKEDEPEREPGLHF